MQGDMPRSPFQRSPLLCLARVHFELGRCDVLIQATYFFLLSSLKLNYNLDLANEKDLKCTRFRPLVDSSMQQSMTVRCQK